MTVVACNQNMMAADRLCVDGAVRQKVTKIRRINGDLVGFAGDYEDGLKFMVWYQDQNADRPSLDNFTGLVLRASGEIILYEDGLIPQPQAGPHYAIGSGVEYALGAMDAGATPEGAVRLCCRRLVGYEGCSVLRRAVGSP